MSPDPQISVLTAVYNNASYIEQTVRSVLAQTFTDFEYILVDDGSTDGSLEIMQRLAEQDDRIRLLQPGRLGISPAANYGLAACRAEWIARLDGDDIAIPDRLEKQLRFVRDHGLVCAGGALAYIDERDRYLTTIKYPLDHETIDANLMQGLCAIPHSGSIFRREVAVRFGGYPEDFCAAIDQDLFLRLAEAGRVGNMDEVVTRYRLHTTSVSAERQSKQAQLARVACERAAERRGIPQPPFIAGEQWRPGSDRGSRHTFAIKFGWWAFNSGEKQTAALYGGKAIALQSWRVDGWRLLACALLKSPPKKPAADPPGGVGQAASS